MPFILEIEKETLLLAIVCLLLGPHNTFIDDFIFMINELLTQHKILTVGDFNTDEMFPENVVKVDSLVESFNLSQPSRYSNHILHEGLLGLISYFNTNAVFFSTITVKWPLCSSFPKSYYIYIEFNFQSLLHNLKILVLISWALTR